MLALFRQFLKEKGKTMRLNAFDPIRHKPYVDRNFIWEQVEWSDTKQGFNFWATLNREWMLKCDTLRAENPLVHFLSERFIYEKFVNNCYYCIPDRRIDSPELQNDHNAILTYVLNPSPSSIVDAFHWSGSPEGQSFWARCSYDWREYFDNYYKELKKEKMKKKQLYIRITNDEHIYSTLLYYERIGREFQDVSNGEVYKVEEISAETGAASKYAPVVVCYPDETSVFAIGLEGVEFISKATYDDSFTLYLGDNKCFIEPNSLTVGCTSFDRSERTIAQLRKIFQELEKEWRIDF